MTELAHAARAGYVVRVARDIEEIAELLPAWRELQGSSITADPDYFLTVLRHKPGVQRPHVVLFERDASPVLMIVGRIEDTTLTLRVGYRTLYRPTVKALTVVYGGFLGDAVEHEAALLVDELLAALQRREAELAFVSHLPTTSVLHREARRRPPMLARQHGARQQPRWRLALPETLEDFLRSRSPRTREGMRRVVRRLEREYGDALTLEHFRRPDQLDRLFADADQVVAKSYQRQLGVSFRDTPLQRQLTQLAMDRKWFRGYMLYLDGRPVAFWHGYAYGGIFRTGTPAYDPALASSSLGTYVLMRMVEDLCADDAVTELDHGFGDAEYKRRFGDERTVDEAVLVFGPSLRARWLNLMLGMLLGLEGMARRIASRSGFAGRLRRGWRRRLESGGQS